MLEKTRRCENTGENKLKFIRIEIEESLRETKIEMTKGSLIRLRLAMKDAEKFGVNVSDIKEQIPELEKKVLLSVVKRKFQGVEKSLNTIDYMFLEFAVADAKKARANVSDVEEQMPELRKKVLYLEAERFLLKLKTSLNKEYLFSLITALSKAKKFGVDVSDIQKDMEKLRKKILSPKTKK